MVFKAAINQSYAMLCRPKDLRNHCAKACTHSPYNLLGLGIRGYGKEVSMVTWWARTTPANHCQVAQSKRRDFNGKLPTGPRTATGYVTKRSFRWLPWQPRTITLLRISLKPHPTTHLFNSSGTTQRRLQNSRFFSHFLKIGLAWIKSLTCEACDAREKKNVFLASLPSLALRFQPLSTTRTYMHTRKYGLFCSLPITLFHPKLSIGKWTARRDFPSHYRYS